MPQDLATATSGFDKLESDWESLHKKPPGTLFHYTTAAGLLGIVEKAKLWATHFEYLNDPSEGRYAQELVARVLAEAKKAYEAKSEAPKEIKAGGGIIGFVGQMITRVITKPRVADAITGKLSILDQHGGAYIACFCRNGDLLSQWRGYGGSGDGYALGFKPAILSSVGGGKVRLRRVIYDPRKQEALIKGWVQQLFDLQETAVNEGLEIIKAKPAGGTLQDMMRQFRARTDAAKQAAASLDTALERFGRFIAECLVSFKNPSYREEAEWRLIVFGKEAGQIKYRAKEGNLIPYVELDLMAPSGNSPVNKVSFGPTLEPRVTERALRMVLGEQVGIQRSKIPFRG